MFQGREIAVGKNTYMYLNLMTLCQIPPHQAIQNMVTLYQFTVIVDYSHQWYH